MLFGYMDPLGLHKVRSSRLLLCCCAFCVFKEIAVVSPGRLAGS